MDLKDYHDYVIKDGKFIGKFEEMYQDVEDPWHHGDATDLQYDFMLYLIERNHLCPQNGTILDLGCGKGALTARLKRLLPHARVVGVDIASTAIQKAQEKYGSLNIDFRTMDIQKEYLCITEQYDCIVMSQLMWYILPYFQEVVHYLITKILSQGGHFLISQVFYHPEVQKYGKEIVSVPEDMVRLVGLPPFIMIEMNRLVDSHYNVISLFRKT